MEIHKLTTFLEKTLSESQEGKKGIARQKRNKKSRRLGKFVEAKKARKISTELK